MRLLFVDDEPRVLEALERMVMELVDDWEIECATSGEAALVVLASAPFDVVVSDMRMPGMDGAALLHDVHLRHPHVTRLVLSGQTEQQSALRALAVAHQFLSKPCRADVLVGTIQRAAALRALVVSDHVRALAAGVDSLPCVSTNALALSTLMRDPNASVVAVSEVFGRDPGLAAKLLQIANSSFFSRGRTALDIRTAVGRVGLDTIRSALGSGLIAPVAPGVHEDRVRALQLDAADAAAIAAMMVPGPLRREAYTAALLCDVGQLVLDRGVPVLGATHAALGAYLLGLWGLPQSIVDAVAAHHEPALQTKPDGGLAAAVHAAHQSRRRSATRSILPGVAA